MITLSCKRLALLPDNTEIPMFCLANEREPAIHFLEEDVTIHYRPTGEVRFEDGVELTVFEEVRRDGCREIEQELDNG